jgi:hypothetical protein
MGTVTHEQARLLLELFDLRREARLRQAREWFVPFCQAQSFEEVMQKFPPASTEGINIRMLTSYWEMAAGLVNRGLIDEDLFFENGGELWVVYDRIKAWLPGQRAAFKNPHNFANLEKLAKRYEEWQEKRAPGAIAATRQMIQQAAAARAKAAKD